MVSVVGAVDVGEVGEAPAGTTDPLAAAEVMVAEQGMAVVEVGVGVVMAEVPVISTVEEDTLAEEVVEVDGGKSDNRCWSNQTLRSSNEITPASPNKFLLSLKSQLSSTCLPGLFALLS